jgi:tetratricopeptide (TPR) repeat protein
MKADPQMNGLHFELAEVLRQSPEPELKAEAEQQYQLALKANPSDAPSLVRLGDYAAGRGEHDAAIAYYRGALKLVPQSADADVGLAHELTETGHPDQALPLLLDAEKSDPTDVLVHFRLAALYRRLNRPEDAHREVAEYERYKAMKDKLHALYKDMRVAAPGSEADSPASAEAKPQ